MLSDIGASPISVGRAGARNYAAKVETDVGAFGIVIVGLGDAAEMCPEYMTVNGNVTYGTTSGRATFGDDMVAVNWETDAKRILAPADFQKALSAAIARDDARKAVQAARKRK